MKQGRNFTQIAFAGIIALAITSYLFITNATPFSLIGGAEQAATETEPVPKQTVILAFTAEPSEAAAQPLLVVVTKPLDQTMEADPQNGNQMKDGADTWTKTLNLVNSSKKPLTIYLYVQGLETCSGTLTLNCVSFLPEITLPANSPVLANIDFKQIKLKEDAPLDAKLILVGAGKQTELPFQIKAGWKAEPVDIILLLKNGFIGLFTLSVFLVIFVILYLILSKMVWPILHPEQELILRMNVTDDTKSLWALFSSRSREIKEAGIGGSLVNPQNPPQGIDLPTNLGKEGEILKAIVELLNWILPRRGISIHLQAVENKKFGKGLSVSLKENANNETRAERIFWAGSYEIDSTTMDHEDLLMTPIVLWVMEWWEKQYPSQKDESPATSRTPWDVQAYLMLASRLWSGDPALGIKLYMDALYRDPSNQQAQAGLGRVWTEYSENEKLSEYEKRNCLELAIAYLKDVTEIQPGTGSAIWFAAMYNLAVAQLYLGDTKGTQESSVILFETIDKQSNSADEDFKSWLGRFKSMALFFKHSVLIETNPPKTQQELKAKVMEAIAEIAKDARIVPAADQLLLVRLDYRTQYNAACYFSRSFRLAKKKGWSDKDLYSEVSLDYLRMALGHRGGLIQLAWRDRALEPIRKDRTLKTRFTAIVPKVEKAKAKEKEEGTVLHIMMDKPVVIKNELKRSGGKVGKN